MFSGQKILIWTFGILLLLIGVASLIIDVFAGVSIILAALTLAPASRRTLYSVARINISTVPSIFATVLLFVVLGVSLLAYRFVTATEQAAETAVDIERAKRAHSKRRHMEFFGLDSWTHPSYVVDKGAQLCIICHSIGEDGPRNFGPRCSNCHDEVWLDDTIDFATK
jgi:hypothetical protein